MHPLPAVGVSESELRQAEVPAFDRATRLTRRLERERRARIEAERLLEVRSRELSEANVSLTSLAAELERRVEQRTSELAAERQRALRLSEEDSLTSLANRAHFTRELDRALSGATALRQGLAVLVIDLDGFKSVNDSFGHPAGDAFLREVARRVRNAVRQEDLVARLGGDEFAVIAHGMRSSHQLRALADRVSRAVAEPIEINQRRLLPSCSIGAASFPADAVDAGTLLGNADTALYAAKRGRPGRVVLFDAILRADIDAKACHEAEVRQAVQREEIVPWMQPIFCCNENRFVGAEVLARWHRPDGAIVLPARFVPTVESLGLLDIMTESLARRAFAECRPLLESGTLRYLAINLSPRQIVNGWAERCLPAMVEAGDLPRRGIVVEITEHAAIQDAVAARAAAAALQRVGIELALDDFGVGYSNFSLLREVSVQTLKLDRSLSLNMQADPTAIAIVDCVIALARRLGIKVIAEGIQTREEAEALYRAGCRAMQGFLFSRPRRHLLPFLRR